MCTQRADNEERVGLGSGLGVGEACDDEVIPSQERIEAMADEADLEDVYNGGLLGPRHAGLCGRVRSVDWDEHDQGLAAQ